MTKAAPFLAALVICCAAGAGEPPNNSAQPSEADRRKAALELEALNETLKAFEDEGEIQGRRFVSACERTTGLARYCACLLEKLPVAYSWENDGWLLYVASMEKRTFVGSVDGVDPKKSAEENRRHIYALAVSARNVCASQQQGKTATPR